MYDGRVSAPRTDLAETWARIERWFAENLPERALCLRPPATEAELADAEHALGRPLPADVRASYRVHDGQDDHGYDVMWLPYAYRLGSLAAIVAHHLDERAFQGGIVDEERMDWLDDAGEVRQVFWHPDRVVIAGSPHWDYDQLVLDFVPGPNGTPGQLIARVDIAFVRLCSGFGSLLQQYADGLEAGRIVAEAPMAWASGWVPMAYRSPRKVKTIRATAFFR